MSVVPFQKRVVPAPDVNMVSGSAKCLACEHKWTAALEMSLNMPTEIECPSCGTMRGVFENGFYPTSGSVRVCNCGNDLFRLTPKGHICARCGTYQTYD